MKKSPFLTGLLLSLFLIGLYWLYSGFSGSKEPSLTPTTALTLLDINYIPLKPKKSFPDQPFYEINSQGSQPKTISDFSGKPAIIHFWATWCSPCVEEMPDLDKFARAHGQDIHVIAIVSNKKVGEDIKKFYEAHNITYLSIYNDENSSLSRTLKINSLPTSLFISKDGQEMGRIIGGVKWSGPSGTLLQSHLLK